MTCWYTVYCKARSEAVAETNLRNQEYYVYLPRLLSRRRRSGKWTDCIEPLFPRYLFVKPRSTVQSLAPIRSTLGVSGLVCFGGQPAVVPDDVIEVLRRREDPVSGACAVEDVFQPGDTVTFLDGPFMGIDAVFSRKTRDDRLVVLLEILGKTNSLKVDPGWLAPAA